MSSSAFAWLVRVCAREITKLKVQGGVVFKSYGAEMRCDAPLCDVKVDGLGARNDMQT